MTARFGEHAVVSCLLAAAAIAVRIVPPGPGSLYPPCPFWWATGWRCAGCGSLRALRALTDLDVAAAWRFNPLFVLFLVGFAVWIVVRLFPRLQPPSAPAWAFRAIPVLIVLFWIGRNL